MRQVDDFAVATPDECMASILFDMIDDKLMIPMKRQGFLDMYIGIDILQTCDYIKIACTTYINKISEKYPLLVDAELHQYGCLPYTFTYGSNMDEEIQCGNG
jgi:hypothetical protein